MKIAMNILVILFAAITFAACEKANDPVAPSTLDKTQQNYYGTFETTYKDYKNLNQTVRMAGTINFVFNQSTYSYNGLVTSSSTTETTGPVNDSGIYQINNEQIQMQDNATKLMSAVWKPSLYLSGNFKYIQSADQVIIEGSDDNGSIVITLHLQ
jgi:hypothetical protein